MVHGRGQLHVRNGGRIYLSGETFVEPKRKGKNAQKEYPQTGTPQYKSGQDGRDGFFTILDPVGNSYTAVYSTLFGGNGLDNVGGGGGGDFALGPQGRVHLCWFTQSTDLTVTSNAAFAANAGWSGYVMKIPNPLGN